MESRAFEAVSLYILSRKASFTRQEFQMGVPDQHTKRFSPPGKFTGCRSQDWAVGDGHTLALERALPVRDGLILTGRSPEAAPSSAQIRDTDVEFLFFQKLPRSTKEVVI
jgi:hypothetical protein